MGNTFQVVLATDTVITVALFIYDIVNEEISAQVGFNVGDGYSSYTLPEAYSPLHENSNCEKVGVYAFRLDSKFIRLCVSDCVSVCKI